MKDVPFKISAIGPMYNCQVLLAKAYTKLEIIFDIDDSTPMMASSIFRRCEKIPTEKSVPGSKEMSLLSYQRRAEELTDKRRQHRIC